MTAIDIEIYTEFILKCQANYTAVLAITINNNTKLLTWYGSGESFRVLHELLSKFVPTDIRRSD